MYSSSHSPEAEEDGALEHECLPGCQMVSKVEGIPEAPPTRRPSPFFVLQHMNSGQPGTATACCSWIPVFPECSEALTLGIDREYTPPLNTSSFSLVPPYFSVKMLLV